MNKEEDHNQAKVYRLVDVDTKEVLLVTDSFETLRAGVLDFLAKNRWDVIKRSHNNKQPESTTS